MRKFTKDTQDLPWCYPQIESFEGLDLYQETPEQNFNMFEEEGLNLLEIAHRDKEVFTRDDMMDAFMKGTSVSYRRLVWMVQSQIINQIKNKKELCDILNQASEYIKRAENK